ncbi:MAG: hypothetical protein ACRC7V_02160 [Lachnospiraceae bacterium]
MNRLDEILEIVKENAGMTKKQETKKICPIVWVFAVIGGVVAIAGIAYALYRYFSPTYLEDFEEDLEDDFDDDFDDDFFEDEDEDEAIVIPKEVKESLEEEELELE